jgi:hypothetical protein
MANFTKGYTFVEHSDRDPALFNRLVDQATLSNVWNNVLDATAIRIPWLIDVTGSPITGDIRVPANFLLQMYFSSQWNDMEGDVQSITLQNNSAVNLLIGDVVCADPASAGGFIIPTIKDDPITTHPLGVLLDNINAGASGRVAYHGPVVIKANPSFSFSAGNIFTLIDSVGSPSAYNQGAATSATPTGGGVVTLEDDRVFGVFLDGGVGGLTHAYIWK